MKTARELVSDVLEGVSGESADRARGRYAGLEVELRFVDRGVGSTRDPWTELVILGEAIRDDLYLGVITQTERDAEDTASGLGTDLRLGDLPFDAAFLVEAGPADVVPGVLDASVREQMLALAPIGLHTRPDGLTVDKPTWLDDPDAIRALVELAVAVVERVPEAFAAVERELRMRGTYRDAPLTSSIDEARRRDIEGVLERKRLREERNYQRGCVLVSLVVIVGLGLSVLFGLYQ